MKKTDEEKIKQAFQDTIWMALRYANGRHTYAPSMVRDAIKMFQEVYPEWEPKTDHTLKKDKGVFRDFNSPMDLDSDWLDDLVDGSSELAEPDNLDKINLDKVVELIRNIENDNLRVRIEPTESGHNYNIGTWEEMGGKEKDSCNNPTEETTK